MSGRTARFVTGVVLMIGYTGYVVFVLVKEGLGDLAGAHYAQNSTRLILPAVLLLGCMVYVAVAAAWRRRGDAEPPPRGVAALLIFVAAFVAVNAVPGDYVSGGVFFVLQTLLWNVTGIFVLWLFRDQLDPRVMALKIGGTALVVFESVVGVLGAIYAGDPKLAALAGAIGCVSSLAMLALALRPACFRLAAPEASSAPRRPE